MLDSHQAFLERLVLLFDERLFAFEFLDFLSLPLSGRLSGLSISKDSLNATLLFFIFGLCSFPVEIVSQSEGQVGGATAYRGGRFVFGVGNS